MEHLWIAASLVAAFFQALRHASLKELNRHLSTVVTTYARVLFGLPLLVAYFAGTLVATGDPFVAPNERFLLFSCLAAVTQFAGTALMIQLFKLGNFAVGVMLTKTDVVLTALVGSLLFSEVISLPGWLAILITFAGVVITSAGRLPGPLLGTTAGGLGQVVLGKPARIGLLSGLIFAISYLSLRESILALGPTVGPLVRSAYAAMAMTAWSFVLLGVWLLLREPDGLRAMRRHLSLCMLVGATSALGTVAWFLATALANASYVAAVAQVQVAFSLAISRYWFRETITRLELAGIGVILAGVLLFRMA